MDNGEAEVSDHVLLPNVDLSSNLQSSASFGSFFGEFLKNTRTCTHTHTCNPPGPDAAHTHTCYHTHTRMFSSEDDEKQNGKKQCSNAKRPAGNREAVRKYREKKKARTAYLEEEVEKLRLLNQQLVRKLQGQAFLQAEVTRLRSLLIDLRGKIENELGAIPFPKPCNSTSIKEGDCRVESGSGLVELQCSTDLPCLHPHTGSSSVAGVGRNDDLMVLWNGENCQLAIGDCQAKANINMNTDGHKSNTVETITSTMSQVEE